MSVKNFLGLIFCLLLAGMLFGCTQTSTPIIQPDNTNNPVTTPNTQTNVIGSSGPDYTPNMIIDKNFSSDNNVTSNSSAKVYTVTIQNFVFSPPELTIKQGEEVLWINMDSMNHTVTSDSGKELDSGLIGTTMSYGHTFSSSGAMIITAQYILA